MEKLSLGGRFIGLSNSTARGSGDRTGAREGSIKRHRPCSVTVPGSGQHRLREIRKFEIS